MAANKNKEVLQWMQKAVSANAPDILWSQFSETFRNQVSLEKFHSGISKFFDPAFLPYLEMAIQNAPSSATLSQSDPASPKVFAETRQKSSDSSMLVLTVGYFLENGEYKVIDFTIEVE